MTTPNIREALRAYLLDDAAISALVGGTRVHPLRLPQGQTLTSIVYSRVSAIGGHTMQGPDGVVSLRVQVDCWARTADQAEALAVLVKRRLDGASGSWLWGDNSPGEAVPVQGVFFDTVREDYDGEAQLHRVSQDFIIWYAEL